MDKMRMAILLGTAFLLTTTSLAALAQTADIPARGPIPFKTYDQNGDGFISETEFNTVRSQRIAARAAEGRPMRGLANAPTFTKLDKNGDGKLTAEELSAGQQNQMQKQRGMGSGAGMGSGGGMGPGGGMGRNMPSFADFDLNGDGKLLEPELNEARAKRISERAQQGYQMRNLGNMPSFADLDTNGDGAVSPEEFAAHQAQRRGQGNPQK